MCEARAARGFGTGTETMLSIVDVRVDPLNYGTSVELIVNEVHRLPQQTECENARNLTRNK